MAKFATPAPDFRKRKHESPPRTPSPPATPVRTPVRSPPARTRKPRRSKSARRPSPSESSGAFLERWLPVRRVLILISTKMKNLLRRPPALEARIIGRNHGLGSLKRHLCPQHRSRLRTRTRSQVHQANTLLNMLHITHRRHHFRCKTACSTSSRRRCDFSPTFSPDSRRPRGFPHSSPTRTLRLRHRRRRGTGRHRHHDRIIRGRGATRRLTSQRRGRPRRTQPHRITDTRTCSIRCTHRGRPRPRARLRRRRRPRPRWPARPPARTGTGRAASRVDGGCRSSLIRMMMRGRKIVRSRRPCVAESLVWPIRARRRHREGQKLQREDGDRAGERRVWGCLHRRGHPRRLRRAGDRHRRPPRRDGGRRGGGEMERVAR